MIARLWHGVVPLHLADDYRDLMRTIAIPEYSATPGNCGAWCLRRDLIDTTEFQMLTFWNDIPSIQQFAGLSYERAKYYDFDNQFLISKERMVSHTRCMSE